MYKWAYKQQFLRQRDALQDFYCSSSDQTEHDHNQELPELIFDSGQALVQDNCQFGLRCIFKKYALQKLCRSTSYQL